MAGRRGAPHLALFPFPLQGHITPMLQLASLFHSRGCSITIVHAEYNSPDHKNYPQFRFEPFADGIVPEAVAATDLMRMLSTIVASCKQPFRSAMERIQSSENPADCVVSDALAYFSRVIAEDLQLPWVIFRTSSPTSFMFFAAFPYLKQMGYIPVKDTELESAIMELPPFRVKDLPVLRNDKFEDFLTAVAEMMDATKKSSAVVLNSSDKLEQPALDRLRSEIPAPIYVVGPLCNYSLGNSTSLMQQDRSCLAWLDEQVHGSVIYVSMGSVVWMDPTQLAQVAQGLADSQQPFLWVIRPGLVQSEEDSIRLLDRFSEKTQDRGRVVKWAPQTEVLMHPAVGGFITHCGWNSTLESICAGKPMLCRPAFGDQRVNARLVCQVWGIGMEMADEFESEKIRNSIRELMASEKKGKEMREKAKLLQELVLECMEIGGSSYEAANKFVDHISSLTSRNCGSLAS